jgi:cation:H+ antiporter
VPSSLPLLVLVFAAAAGAVWFAGIRLSETTDVLSTRFHMGEALGGLILLAVATNLPEIAITFSAAQAHTLGIAVGNILGGIAIQTLVLVILDISMGPGTSLTYRAASLVLVLEGVLLMALLAVVVMGTQMPSSVSVGGLEPASLTIVVLWLAGLHLIDRARAGLPWHESGTAPDGQAEPRGHAAVKTEHAATGRHVSTARAIGVFGIAAIVTLAGGVSLERSGERIAGHIGLSGVIFGATILAAATGLPEVSTGLASVRLGDYQLAVSDIFGGNAFLTVLFLPAGLISGAAVLPAAHASDIYLTALGGFLTAIYIYGLIYRPRRLIAGIGIDSFAVLAAYAIGMVGLIAVTHG